MYSITVYATPNATWIIAGKVHNIENNLQRGNNIKKKREQIRVPFILLFNILNKWLVIFFVFMF